jgi:arylsulfatase A-like enzyme
MKAINMVRLVVVVCAMCAPFVTVYGSGQIQTRPNVIVVLIDNMGYYELSRNGHQVVQTPRLDQLSEQAAYFSDFNAPPFCSPSRTALLTGRYALRAGVHNTVGGVSILNKDEITMADMLKKAGYHTAVFGKWHLGNTYPYAPKYRGFDEVFIHGGGGVSQLEDYYGNNHLDATWEHNGQYVKSRGFSTDVLFDQGIDFIGRNREAPFFCFISTPAVHFPTLKHPEVTKRMLARGVEDSKFLAIYSMIENVDDNIGRLLDYLVKIKIRENTLLIVASDQGVNDRGADMHRAGEFVNRGVQYDEKHQVYCMIQYPELTDGNPGDIPQLAGMVDLLPTVLDICGLENPGNLDGQNLRPLLAGSNAWDDERKLIVQCPRKRERFKWDNVSVKYKKWRFVDGEELYNVALDRGQLNNIIDEHPELVEELTKTYEVFWNSLPPGESLIPPHILGSEAMPSVRLNGMDWYKGDAPWTQGALDKKTSQGTWLVEIARDGSYRFELRRYPREASKPIGATEAAIEVGPVQKMVKLDEADKKAILELNLARGRYDMRSTFIDRSGAGEHPQWGAYYVYVSFIE